MTNDHTPGWVTRAVRLPVTVALVAALDMTLWRRLPADVRAKLLGRRVEICVTDWNASFCFTARPFGFVPRRRFGEPELRIAACAHDFGALAAGEDDADTLYFSRRLVVEGDTELALMVKNTMDALDATRGRALARRAHRVAKSLREKRAARRAAAHGF
jgi:predicted lipid carrier protein YhbT